MDLRTIIATSADGACTHEPVCEAVHRALEPDTPTSDYYCCRSTGSLCEAIYDGFYDGVASGDRIEAILVSVRRWTDRDRLAS